MKKYIIYLKFWVFRIPWFYAYTLDEALEIINTYIPFYMEFEIYDKWTGEYITSFANLGVKYEMDRVFND